LRPGWRHGARRPSRAQKKGRCTKVIGPSLGRKRPERAAKHLCLAFEIWHRSMFVSSIKPDFFQLVSNRIVIAGSKLSATFCYHLEKSASGRLENQWHGTM
jgi:hypothetical protein